MKKFAVAVVVAFFFGLILSACSSTHNCPAYSQAEQAEQSTNDA
jgi:hypothetical protein